MLKLHFFSVDLKLSEAFTIAANSRTVTEAIFVEIDFEGMVGYGQASFPPYLKEKREDNLHFLASLDLKLFKSPFSIEAILIYLDKLSPACNPAKAAIDMAFHDLMGKLTGLPVYKLLGLETNEKIYTSYTIGMGDENFIQKQVQLAADYKTLKVKLGGNTAYNRNIIELLRNHTAQPICVDFNQGIENNETALSMIKWLSDKNVLFVEQPFAVKMEKEYLWLKKESPLPVFGDESIQNAADVINKQEQFHGVNIKLMKCGGMRNAFKLASLAKELGLKTMLGCMTESVCAVTAAAHLSPLFDKIDLDGNLLIAADPFMGVIIDKGEIIIPNKAGLGVERRT